MKLKYFYKIEDDKLIRGSGYKIPDGFIEYEKGSEPQEFLDLYHQELLENAKQLKKRGIEQTFNNTLSQGYTCSNGIKMNSTDSDIRKLKDGYDLANALGSETMIVRDYNNENHELTLNEVFDMLKELGANYQTQLQKLWKLKDDIVNSNSIEDVENIRWN